MLEVLFWNFLFGIYLVVIQVPTVESRVGYSSKETSHPAKVTCNGTNGEDYVCSYGHCCEDGCCSYYYELWWFWLIWGLVILLSCCCFYHQRQKHLAQRSRQHRMRRNKDRYEGVCNYPGPPLENKLMGSCKLPVYKDVIRMPPTSSPPPPYSSRRRSIHTIACLQANERGETSMSIIPCNITSSMLSLASLSHYIPDILADNTIRFKPIQRVASVEPVDDNNNNPMLVTKENNPADIEKGPSSPLIPPKPKPGVEILKESSSGDRLRKLSLKSTRVVNGPKSSDDDSRVDYDDCLPQYESTTCRLLHHNAEQDSLLGSGSNGDVVLNLTP